ncbi:OB-fold domain-containing protein [Catenulispora sp. NL8]|uniref:OB-fold domain-containing protein n=1 Tax=Catenulispora pinistramenti TaxID=2705254 RepID=A0ABS5KIP4_9ACTN|nr:zinc ribbon domain-containing protein [Catenulispora pinistramenti]MBS2545998.1 OB-fold domain-containing protein [Catenulispora pinistramenti]
MTRPQPVIGRDNAYYWEGVAKGAVLIQKCTACGSLRHPPSPMCPECQSLDWTTVKATGHATLHSYTICHHPLPPWEEGPYAVVLIDLEIEDSDRRPRIVCGAKGIANEDLRIEMPLSLVFEDGLVFAGPAREGGAS